MTDWSTFAEQAPEIAEVFRRRHAAASNLCLLATLRSDGYPRISPVEPRFIDGELAIVGMEGTYKFKDLSRDPRFSLHTATVDTQVTDGDAKVWGVVRNRPEPELYQRFADDLFEESGFDLRGQVIDPFYVADVEGASSLEVDGDELVITIWKQGQGIKVVRKR